MHTAELWQSCGFYENSSLRGIVTGRQDIWQTLHVEELERGVHKPDR